MKLKQIKEHELREEVERLDEISKRTGGLVGKIAGVFAGFAGGTAMGAGAGAVVAGPVGLVMGALIGQIAGIIAGEKVGGELGRRTAKGDEYDIAKWERKLKELKDARKFAVREYEKQFMTKENKRPATIRGLHELDMRFVKEIQKIEKLLKRAIK